MPTKFMEDMSLKFCPRCREAKLGKNFCNECGAETIALDYKCPKCSNNVFQTDKFCGKCGVNLAEACKEAQLKEDSSPK